MDREITITISDDEARRIQQRVEAGEFRSASEYVRAAMSHYALDAEPEWIPPDDVLRQLVEESLRDPRRLSREEVHRSIMERHKQRINETK
jgi:Arc/MetJ-type ribon-helix-helix transcriptional regulator